MAKNSQKDDIGFLYTKLALGAETRNEESKGKYPKGRIRQVFNVFGAEMNPLMRVNCWFLLFALPLMVVLFWYSTYASALAIKDFNFMGNVGMAYPGGSDDVARGLVAIYDAYQMVLYLCLPALVILSIGVAGSFYCFKSFMWGEKVEKITKTFFTGVKKYWWRYLIVVTFDALLILGLGSTFIFFLKMQALGTLTAGYWVLLIFVCLIAFLLLYVNMTLLPFLCELDLSFGKQIKNALIISIKFAPVGLPIFLVMLAPICLILVDSAFIKMIIGILVLMFYSVLLGLAFTGFSQMALDQIITPLYKLSVAPKNENKRGKKGNAPGKQVKYNKQNKDVKKDNGGN